MQFVCNTIFISVIKNIYVSDISLSIRLSKLNFTAFMETFFQLNWRSISPLHLAHNTFRIPRFLKMITLQEKSTDEILPCVNVQTWILSKRKLMTVSSSQLLLISHQSTYPTTVACIILNNKISLAWMLSRSSFWGPSFSNRVVFRFIQPLQILAKKIYTNGGQFYPLKCVITLLASFSHALAWFCNVPITVILNSWRVIMLVLLPMLFLNGLKAKKFKKYV